MAGKLTFDRESLAKAISDDFDRRMEQADTELVQSNDPDYWAQQRAGWRTEAEERLSALFRSLGDAPDAEVAAFRLPPLPEMPDRYERRRLKERPTELRDAKAKSLAKVQALRTHDGGAIDLTANQLREFFGLS